MLNNELPTLCKLSERKPHLYDNTNNKCRACNNELETREHLFECDELEHLNKKAWENMMDKVASALEELLNKEEGEKENNNGINRLQREMFIDSLTKKEFVKRGNRMRFALKIMEKGKLERWNKIFGNKVSTSKMNKLLEVAGAKFLESFRKITWRERCKETVKVDKILGIDL